MTSMDEKPWVILITRSDNLGAPVVGVSLVAGQEAHVLERIRRFATREKAEAFLKTCVERKPQRCYTVTTL